MLNFPQVIKLLDSDMHPHALSYLLMALDQALPTLVVLTITSHINMSGKAGCRGQLQGSCMFSSTIHEYAFHDCVTIAAIELFHY